MEESNQSIPAPRTAPATGQALVKPDRGVLVLVLGIVGIVLCFICGIIAWVMGANDLKQMDAGTMDPAGRGLTNAGKICGIIGTILGCVRFLITIVMLIFFLFIHSTRCVEHRRIHHYHSAPIPLRPVPVPPSLDDRSDLPGPVISPPLPQSEQ